MRNKAFLQNLAEYTEKLLDAAPEKDEAAKGDSLKAVLHILAHWPLPNKAALRKKAIRKVARLLPTMKKPPDLWEDEWQVIASPAMVPYLLRTFQSHSGFEEQHQRWLYQVAPVRAQELMISAVQQGVSKKSGKPYAMVTLEDLEGAVQILCMNENYDKYREKSHPDKSRR